MKRLSLKVMSLITASVLMFGVVACGPGEDANETTTTAAATTTAPAEEETEEPTEEETAQETEPGTESETETEKATEPETDDTEEPSETTEGSVLDIEKYDPPIDLTAWRFLNAGIQFAEGDTIDDNVYIDYYREEFGINLTYDWVVPEEQFDARLNIAIVSGDLPDIMWLNNKALIEMAEADLLYDLTDLYESNTSEFTKSILEQDITSFNTAKINDRLMGIPHTGSAIDGLQILYVRTDWLDNLDLEVPETMDDLLAVAEAFTFDDPDGNGQDDTYGLALTQNFIGDNHAGATGFFAGYHGYLRRWVEQDDGSVVYGSVQPEIREGLATLQDMFARGILDPEFGVKDRSKVTESIASGKIGITYGGMSTPGAFLESSVHNDNDADWVAIPLVSIDDQPAEPIARMPVTRYYAVNKDSENPEAIMKLLDASAAGYSRELIDESEWQLGITDDGVSVFQYQLIGFEPAQKNLIAHRNVIEALDTGDTSELNTEELGYYERTLKYREGDIMEWGNAHIFATPSSFDVISHYVDTGDYTYNAFYGSMTPTMVERNATLEAMEDEVFTTIIMGDSLDRFDQFVEDWNVLGGSDITDEVNEWFQRSN